MQLLCSSSLCLHLVNSLIASAPAVVSADEAFISVSAILAPADQIGSTETKIYAIGGAGSTSTTGSAIGPLLPFVMKLRSTSSGSREIDSSTGAQMLLTDLAYPASDDG